MYPQLYLGGFLLPVEINTTEKPVEDLWYRYGGDYFPEEWNKGA